MLKPFKIQGLLAAALMISLVAFVPDQAFGVCKNAGASYSGTKLSSQVTKNTVKVCASALKVQPARSVVVKKVVAAPAVSKLVFGNKVVFRKSGTVINLKPAVKPIVKKVIKKKASSKIKKTVKKKAVKKAVKSFAKFRPNAVLAGVSTDGVLAIGQSVTFDSSSVEHFKYAPLLTLNAQVRFTPIGVAWSYGDGESGEGKYTDHAFYSAGTKQVQLTVIYAVSYRAKGTGRWISEPGQVKVSDSLTVTVASGSSSKPKPTPSATPIQKTLLVGSTCTLKPSSFGCP
ncbi:MAG: hypothetical protein ACKOWH_00695 [Rhodoluna sp.]